jgi:hypothetical protein
MEAEKSLREDIEALKTVVSELSTLNEQASKLKQALE